MVKWSFLLPMMVVSETQAQSDFAWKLAPLVDKDAQGNVVFSPYSVSMALSMAYAGAEGNTAQAFEKTLGIKGPASEHHSACLALETRFGQRAPQTPAQDDSYTFRMSTANRLYAQEGAALKASFVDVLKSSYASELQRVDFLNATEPTRLAINSWVKEKTEGFIKDVLPPHSLSPAVRMLLVNAIYFQAPWQQPFEEARTSLQPFTMRDGKNKDVSMMEHGRLNVRAAALKDVEVVEIPYDVEGLSMVVLMPTVNSFDGFVKQLSAKKIEALLQQLKPETIQLRLPKFEKTVHVNLGDPLRRLGLKEAFSSRANFSGMSENESFQLSSVVHQAFIRVSEKGTKAAAATAVGSSTGPMMPFRSVNIQQPFLFVIRDSKTKAILFLGQIVSP